MPFFNRACCEFFNPPATFDEKEDTLTMEKRRDVEKMSSEHTPLIQHVPVADQRERYPHTRVSLERVHQWYDD